MREVKTQFPRGKVVRERYTVEELLGQGGFGAVYRVRDRRVRGNVFALKEVIDPDRRQRENFMFEGEVLRRLDHPFLPRVYRVFEDEKNHRLYMLMDYIAGPNLERLRHQQPDKRFSLSQALRIMEPIMEAVSYLHAQQPPIIHRDIKPSNIIVLTSGEGAVLVDFGIAKEYDRDSTTTAIRHCSPGYGAPEQYVQGTTTQTDIYGLGATLYTLLAGEVPIDSLYRITRLSGRGVDPLQPVNELVPELPQEVADILQRAMAVNSQDRFATVQEFWDALRVYADEEEEKTGQEALPDLVPETPSPVADTPVLAVASAIPANEPIVESPTTDAHIQHDQPEHQRGKGRLLLAGIVALTLVALFSGIFVAYSSTWSGSPQSSAHNLMTPSPAAHRNQTPTVAVKTPVPSPTTVPPTVGSTPTPQNVTYPGVASSYSGTIHNQPAQVDSSISLSQMQQNGAQIHGYLTLGPGLLGSGPFDGSVTTDRKINFLRPMGGNYLPLYFEGQFQADGSISGTYCSLRDDRCDPNGGGYGTWQVAPSGAPAQASSGMQRTHIPPYLIVPSAGINHRLNLNTPFA